MSEFDIGDQEPKPVSISVALILETESGGLVMVRQKDTRKWGPIAGHIKTGESLDQALTREMWEEAGITINDIEDIHKWETPYVYGADKDSFGVVFRAKSRLTDQQINRLIPSALEEIEEVRVFSPEEIYEMIQGSPNFELYVPKYNLRNLMRWLISKHQENRLLTTLTMEG